MRLFFVLACLFALPTLTGAGNNPFAVAQPNPWAVAQADPFAVASVDPFAPVKPAAKTCCSCACGSCGPSCSCSYPGECSDLRWVQSDVDSGWLLCSRDKVLGGLYSSGKFRPYRNGEWGAYCEPPIARPVARTASYVRPEMSYVPASYASPYGGNCRT